jgi:hypothetical protein
VDSSTPVVWVRFHVVGRDARETDGER